MRAQKLDKYCVFILLALYWESKPLGFNQLHKIVDKLFGISKPTLSLHLKHLISKKLIIKEKEDYGNFNLSFSKYELAPEIYDYLPAIQPTLKKWERLATKKDFKDLAWHLYDDFGVLCMLTLYYQFKAMLGETDATKGLWLSQASLQIFIETLYQKIQIMLKNAKKGEIAELMKEWEGIVEKYRNLYLKSLSKEK